LGLATSSAPIVVSADSLHRPHIRRLSRAQLTTVGMLLEAEELIELELLPSGGPAPWRATILPLIRKYGGVTYIEDYLGLLDLVETSNADVS
jgi:hypothetical protein